MLVCTAYWLRANSFDELCGNGVKIVTGLVKICIAPDACSTGNFPALPRDENMPAGCWHSPLMLAVGYPGLIKYHFPELFADLEGKKKRDPGEKDAVSLP